MKKRNTVKIDENCWSKQWRPIQFRSGWCVLLVFLGPSHPKHSIRIRNISQMCVCWCARWTLCAFRAAKKNARISARFKIHNINIFFQPICNASHAKQKYKLVNKCDGIAMTKSNKFILSLLPTDTQTHTYPKEDKILLMVYCAHFSARLAISLTSLAYLRHIYLLCMFIRPYMLFVHGFLFIIFLKLDFLQFIWLLLRLI